MDGGTLFLTNGGTLFAGGGTLLYGWWYSL